MRKLVTWEILILMKTITFNSNLVSLLYTAKYSAFKPFLFLQLFYQMWLTRKLLILTSSPGPAALHPLQSME